MILKGKEPLYIRAAGKRAIYCRPQYAVERSTRDIPTSQALEGMLAQCMSRPGVSWHVHRVCVMNKIRHGIMQSNEVDKAGNARTIYSNAESAGYSNLSPDSNRIMRYTRFLTDVEYLIVATIELDSAGVNPGDSLQKVYGMARRRLAGGQSFDYVCGGERPFGMELTLLDTLPDTESYYHGRQINMGMAPGKDGNPVQHIMNNGWVDYDDPSCKDPSVPLETSIDMTEALALSYDSFRDKGYVSDIGMSAENIKICLDLSFGEVPKLRYLREDKKAVLMQVPAKRIRTTECRPNFGWHNAVYILGYQKGGKSAPWVKERHEAFLEYHRKAFEHAKGDVALSLYDFASEKRMPEIPSEMQKDLEISNIALFCNGKPVWEDEDVLEAWNKQRLNDWMKSERIICSISGKEDYLAVTHPKIKNLYGGKMAESTLISVNVQCAQYKGREQGAVAMIGMETAARYATVLNFLLSDKRYWTRIEDMVILAFTQDADLAVTEYVTSLISNGSAGLPVPASNDKSVHLSALKLSGSRIFVALDMDLKFSEICSRMEEYGRKIQLNGAPIPLWKMLSFMCNDSVGTQAASLTLESILAGDRIPRGIVIYGQSSMASKADNSVCRRILSQIEKWNEETSLISEEKISEENAVCASFEEKLEILGQLFSLFGVVDSISASKSGKKGRLYEAYLGMFCTSPVSMIPPLYDRALKQASFINGNWKYRLTKKMDEILAFMDEIPIIIPPVYHLYIRRGMAKHTSAAEDSCVIDEPKGAISEFIENALENGYEIIQFDLTNGSKESYFDPDETLNKTTTNKKGE